jgi:peptidyl-prolyl cis-trans isomerase C
VVATTVFSLGMLLEGGHTAKADPPVDPTRVVARVGKDTITVGELERRLAHTPRFQLGTYGTSPDEIRRNFLQTVLVPEYLYAQAAVDRGLTTSVETQIRERDILKAVYLKRLHDEAANGPGVTDQEVLAYYNEHLSRYQTPMRVSIWRILVKTREEALQVLAEAKRDTTPKTWMDLARAKSVDQTNNLSGGNFGFVTQSGDSADSKTKIPQAVVDAAYKVHDGELVSEPVAEGSGFAVIWRRGSTPAMNRSLLDERDSIRGLLQHKRAADSQQAAIDKLKQERVTDLNPAGTNLLEVSSQGQISKRSKPGRVERHPAEAIPELSPRGFR